MATSAGRAKAVLVTGAARGIGSAIAARLRDDGWNVHAVDVADGDLTTREGNRAVVETAVERFGRLDAVVANAGSSTWRRSQSSPRNAGTPSSPCS
jgi:NAD(P)-dependent dehydrogenase (short-subunit alcohol dehydrogenase family)